MPASSPDTVDIEAEVQRTPGIESPEREWVFASPVMQLKRPLNCEATGREAVSSMGKAAPTGQLYVCDDPARRTRSLMLAGRIRAPTESVSQIRRLRPSGGLAPSPQPAVALDCSAMD